jgi:2-amino-4-hydroxy-6-hydroxymethyldihydropteridine diphosphokinase
MPVLTEQLEQEYAFIALGSNLGDSPERVRGAIAKLQTLSSEPILQSSLWESEPVDCPPGSPRFINAVIALKPQREETPESLLGTLQSLERQFGRRPKQVLNEARSLDLDLITFGRQTRASSSLILPHPRAHLRAFVLKPMAEICADFVLPNQRENVTALLAKTADAGDLRRIPSK